MQDRLTPEEIEGTSFPDGEGGYDRLHVDAFLTTMAAQVRRLQRELEVALERAEAPFRAAGKEIGDLIQDAKDRAAELVSEAEDGADRIIKDAHNEAMLRRQETGALRKAALTAQQEAERTRDRIVADAHAEAAAMVERATEIKRRFEAEGRVIVQEAEREVRGLKEKAKKEADKARAAVEREHAELSSRLEHRIRVLRKAEATLTGRVAALKTDTASAEPPTDDAAVAPDPEAGRTQRPSRGAGSDDAAVAPDPGPGRT